MLSRALEEIACAIRVTRNLPGFVRRPISPTQASERLRRRLETREATFVRLVEEAVFNHPISPYLKLFRSISCELGDLRQMVRRHGLEATLSRLADEGLYLTFDEFKGRTPVVRGGHEFRFSDSDFDNPLIRPDFVLWTGGSRAPAMSVRVALAFAEEMAVSTSVALEANGLSNHRHAYWLLSTALTLSLRQIKLGRPPLAWFYPLSPIPMKGRLGTLWLEGMTRVLGRPLAAPRFMDMREPKRMVEWLAASVKDGPVLLTCYASSVVRICRAAVENGTELRDVCFVTFGEPYTFAKRQIVQAAGARAVSHYGFTEGGLVGYSCANPAAPDDVHLFEDVFALVQKPRAVSAESQEVMAFLLTSLIPTAPKIMLNVEPGDHGAVEQRACGCGLESVGLRRHISLVRSYEKLTGEGMTFVKGNLLRMLEVVLPARFGGGPTDYQLVEEEDSNGIVRLRLLVSPKVGTVDEARLGATFLAELSRDGGPSRTGAATWEKAGTLRIERCEPIATAAGKILPFHLIKL
jgi:hypothetical protein